MGIDASSAARGFRPGDFHPGLIDRSRSWAAGSRTTTRELFGRPRRLTKARPATRGRSAAGAAVVCPYLRREDVEIADADQPVAAVIEITLRKRLAGLAVVGREHIEVVDLDRAVVVRVGGLKEEIKPTVGRKRVAGSVRYAGSNELGMIVCAGQRVGIGKHDGIAGPVRAGHASGREIGDVAHLSHGQIGDRKRGRDVFAELKREAVIRLV